MVSGSEYQAFCVICEIDQVFRMKNNIIQNESIVLSEDELSQVGGPGPTDGLRPE